MELHGVAGRVFCGGEDAEGFQNGDAAGAVVIGAGGSGGGAAAGGIEVGAYDYEGGGGAGDAGDDGGLVVGMRELGYCDAGVGCGDGFDAVEEPGARLSTVGGLVVAIIEA